MKVYSVTNNVWDKASGTSEIMAIEVFACRNDADAFIDKLIITAYDDFKGIDNCDLLLNVIPALPHHRTIVISAKDGSGSHTIDLWCHELANNKLEEAEK